MTTNTTKRHRFATIDGSEPATFPNRLIDMFQFDDSWHNGPRCVDCGASRCCHCNPNFMIEECRGKQRR